MNGDPGALRRFNFNSPAFRGVAVAVAVGTVIALGSCSAGEGTDVLSATSISVSASPESPLPSPTELPANGAEFAVTPTWEQNFATMERLDTSVWNFDLQAEVPTWNEEKQAYTNKPENVRVVPGTGLIIEARRESKPYVYPGEAQGRKYDYTSGRITTAGTFSFSFGRVETIMQMPAAVDGVWAAGPWFLSDNNPFPQRENGEDYLRNGELDGMEFYGRIPGAVESTVQRFKGNMLEKLVSVPDASDAFHTYATDVTPTHISFSLDGTEYFRVEKPVNATTDEWPYQKGNELYMIFNLAMGGTGGGPIDPAFQSTQFKIASVKYFPLKQD